MDHPGHARHHLKIVEDLPLSQIEGLKSGAKEMLHDRHLIPL
jgi:hypothetical protein